MRWPRKPWKKIDKRGALCPQCQTRLNVDAREHFYCEHCGWHQGQPINPLPIQEEQANGKDR